MPLDTGADGFIFGSLLPQAKTAKTRSVELSGQEMSDFVRIKQSGNRWDGNSSVRDDAGISHWVPQECFASVQNMRKAGDQKGQELLGESNKPIHGPLEIRVERIHHHTSNIFELQKNKLTETERKKSPTIITTAAHPRY